MRLRGMLAAALGLAALGAPPAAAHDSTYTGGCGYDTLRDATPHETLGGRYTYHGAVSFVVALTSGTHDPVAADVSCELWTNGVPRTVLPATRVTAAGVAAAPLSFTSTPGDDVTLCTVVTYADSTPPARDCLVEAPVGFPPREVLDVVNLVLDPVEAAACAALGGQAPGVPGLVDVTPEGDVYVVGGLVVDCAPYRYPPPYRFPHRW